MDGLNIHEFGIRGDFRELNPQECYEIIVLHVSNRTKLAIGTYNYFVQSTCCPRTFNISLEVIAA